MFRKCIIGVLLIALTTVGFADTKKETWPIWLVFNPFVTKSIDHNAFGKFLQKYIVKSQDGINLVAYDKVSRRDRQLLRNYISRLSQVPINEFNRDEQLAYWINLYNALTIKVVLEHYPVRTIKDINISPGLFTVGPWKAKVISVNGIRVSLDDIEHRIVRPIWNDPRVHYALNCASIGCPNIASKPYRGATIDKQLDKAARGFINSLRGCQVINNKLITSKIYDWFKSDFGATDQDVIFHLSLYAGPELKKQLKSIEQITSFTYNWHLNRTRPKLDD